MISPVRSREHVPEAETYAQQLQEQCGGSSVDAFCAVEWDAADTDSIQVAARTMLMLSLAPEIQSMAVS